MPTYLDVAAVRIQSYLGRTTELRLSRAASWLLTAKTSPDETAEWIRGLGIAGVETNDEAGHADGVISLIVPAGQEQAIARQLMIHLRGEMPAAELQAVWGTADTYLEAYGQLAARRADPLLSIPPTVDFPLAVTCGSCRVSVRVVEERCADCDARETVAGRRRTGDDQQDALSVERSVLREINERKELELRTVKDLEELAGIGSPDGRSNHVATVALDGNAMGAFFTALSKEPDPELKRQISPQITLATRRALVHAVAEIVRPDDRALSAIPHLLGGDDVAVSVTAGRAWHFVTAFLREFGRETERFAGRLELPDAIRSALPTMSAGVIFAHYSFPYARAAQIADETLRRAKRATCGKRPAVAWVDVTVDGESPPVWRQSFELTALEGHADTLAALGEIGKSGRQTLARLLAHEGHSEEPRAAALLWARRSGHTALQNPLHDLSLGELRNLVALTRWWKP